MNNEVSRRDFLRLTLGGLAAPAVSSQLARSRPAAPPTSPFYKTNVRVARYDGNRVLDDCTAPLVHYRGGSLSLNFAGALWVCDYNSALVPDRSDAVNFSLRFHVRQGNPRNHSVGVRLIVDDWSTDNYVLIPAALYNGNRFESRHLAYPPLLTDPRDIGPKVPTIITDVPRLNISSGPSKVQLIVGDMSTPAIGFYVPKTRQGLWLLTDQRTGLGDTGLTIEESLNRKSAYISLTAPHVREKYKYRICTTTQPSDDRGADFKMNDQVQLRFRVYSFPCPTIQALFDRFVEIRKDLSGPVMLHHELPFSAGWKIQEEKYNRSNWVDSYGYYSVGMRDNRYEDWQPGWTGGLIATYPLIMEGNDTSRARVLRNFDFAFPGGTGPSGYVRGVGYEGKWYSDGFEKPYATKWEMSRKSADVLYFMVKQFMLLEKQWKTVSPIWRTGVQRLADAFLRTWNKFGQFGQFVHIDTGDVIVGGSTSAGIASAGLALASCYFKQPEYMNLATANADYFYNHFVRLGVSTGGPGEICQCPDSESAFGLLESFVVLYEISRNPKWLQYATEMAHQCATWMVSYDFEFPPTSLFGRLEMHSAGAVFANAQNKHGAPGICTLSGNSLFKLYRYTGRRLYLEMVQELAHNLTQYLSRSDRRVGQMPAGWMNERVQLSDWLEPIGEIFYSSTWPEVSNMLTWVELPGLYVQPDSGFFCAIDHVDVSVCSSRTQSFALEITNPTHFDASVRVLSEDSTEARRILGQNYLIDCPRINVRAGSSRKITFPLNRGN